jgi:hypothetical protein
MRRMSAHVASFGEWQPRYTVAGVALFPVNITADGKVPAVRGYMRIGPRVSAQLTFQFGEARSFVFTCGPRNRLTIVDVDSQAPSALRAAEDVFRASPVLWRTGGGNFAMAFRHNGEGRRIRPIRGEPFDVLGNGSAVAPPSAGARQPYEFLRGGLDDFATLPTARILPLPAQHQAAAPLDAGPIPQGERNFELFRYCRSVVPSCASFDQLIDAATAWAGLSLARLPDSVTRAEIKKTCRSVWRFRGVGSGSGTSRSTPRGMTLSWRTSMPSRCSRIWTPKTAAAPSS